MPLQPNLTGVLALTALADLLLHRLAAHIFLPAQGASGLARLFGNTGLFAANLGGVLGLILVITALLRALRGETVFPRSMRITVSAVALVFVMLAGLGVFSADGNGRFLAHLQISLAFLSVFLVTGAWRTSGSGRGKLGLTLLALPGIMQAAALFLDNRPWAPGLPGQLVRAADVLGLLGLAVAPLLLVPRPWRGLRLLSALGAGAGAVGAALWVVSHRFDIVQLVALYGFRLELPGLTAPMGWLYAGLVVASLAGLTSASIGCLIGPASSRLRAYGLVLIAAAGHLAVASNLAIYSLSGLIALSLGSVFAEQQTASMPAIREATPDVN